MIKIINTKQLSILGLETWRNIFHFSFHSPSKMGNLTLWNAGCVAPATEYKIFTLSKEAEVM